MNTAIQTQCAAEATSIHELADILRDQIVHAYEIGTTVIAIRIYEPSLGKWRAVLDGIPTAPGVPATQRFLNSP